MNTPTPTEKAEAQTAEDRAQFTPGPWRTQESARGFQINAPGHEPGNSTVVATIHETAVFANEPDHAGADARLIASAPELLQAIRDIQHNAQVMNQAEPNRVWTAIDDACRTAIAKAEGRI